MELKTLEPTGLTDIGERQASSMAGHPTGFQGAAVLLISH
jgi:hypothetical protein